MSKCQQLTDVHKVQNKNRWIALSMHGKSEMKTLPRFILRLQIFGRFSALSSWQILRKSCPQIRGGFFSVTNFTNTGNICTHSGGELANLIAGSKNFLIGSGFDRGIGWWKTYIGRICCWKHISIKATENIHVKLHTFKLLALQQIYSGKSHLWVELGTRDNGCDNMNTVLSTTNCRLSCYRYKHCRTSFFGSEGPTFFEF